MHIHKEKQKKMSLKWTEQNKVILKDNYPNNGANIKELLAQGITKNAIRSKASLMGIKRLPIKIPYTDAEERVICTYVVTKCNDHCTDYPSAIQDIRGLGVTEHSDRSVGFKFDNYRYIHTGYGLSGGRKLIRQRNVYRKVTGA